MFAKGENDFAFQTATVVIVTSEVERIARAIEDYLAGHPDGVDTAEGVACWWLPAMGVVASVETTELALMLLIGQGVACRQRSANGHVLYSRCGRASRRRRLDARYGAE